MLNDRKALIENLLKFGYIKTEKVRKAMETVDREEFIPNELKPYAYLDRPLPLEERQTISAPHLVAKKKKKKMIWISIHY